ncbi:Pectinesterase [Quillaja saponaria]|uniref:Pectinesterase n=1 Tax=Quillaja saponaria TaxID=32244 RepID=A0AAD7LPB9_QUISA|nr:Pectinesterase [Quillaja saponaria]
MARQFTNIRTLSTILIIAVTTATTTVVFSDDTKPIDADKSQVSTWFNNNLEGDLKTRLDPQLAEAEQGPVKIITVMKNGGGDFKTITEAINSIPNGNTKRVVVKIDGGVYNEKIKIERTKPFITLYGLPNNMPNLTYAGTALQYGTVDSATLIVESDYFVAVNLNIVNTAPRPDGKRKGAQALALRISGDKAAFYNCKLFGFQDTICDDKGKHLFMNCYIEGTVDFIFGNGKSLYVNTTIHVLVEEGFTVITAHARQSPSEDTGYVFVHCSITGTGNGTFLGRAWMTGPRVIFAYTSMDNIVNPAGWTNNFHPERESTVYFGEFKNTGPGSDPKTRVKFVKQLSDAEVKPFISLGYIEGSKWLLPPPKL